MKRTAGMLFLLSLVLLPSGLGRTSFAPTHLTTLPLVPALGQPVQTDPAGNGRLAFRITRNRDGLPQNSVQALAFDGKGYLWAGTQDGAARYDGRAWTVLNMPNRTVSNYIRVITKSRDGSLWFGTREGGVSHFTDGTWDHFDTANGLPHNGVRCVMETLAPDGTPLVWVGTESGLARFDGTTWSPVLIAAGKSTPRVNCLLETEPGSASSAVWVGTDTGLARLQHGIWTLYTVDAGLPNPTVSAILEATLGSGQRKLIVGTTDGLAEFSDGRWRAFGPKGKAVRSLGETTSPDGARTLWIGTAGSLDRLNNAQWSTYDVRSGLPGHSINCLLSVDAPGGTRSLFVGTDAGLAEWESGTWVAFDSGTGLPADMTFSFLETVSDDAASTVWIGTENGIARSDGATWTTLTTADGLPHNRALCMLESRDGADRSIWIGTSGGLAHYSKGGWKTFTTADGLPDNGIRCLLETVRPDGQKTLWAGTYGGLAKLDGTTWSTFTTRDGLPNNGVLSLIETQDAEGSTLWIGTYGGLARMQGDAITPEPTTSGFPTTGVRSFLLVRPPTGGRTLWVGTSGAGVARRDLDDPDAHWVTLDDSTQPALPNNVVYQLQADRKGRIYLLTNRGIARLTRHDPTPDNPLEFDVSTFTVNNGLPNNESNAGASMVDSRGRIWAGTVAGAAMYDPALEIEDTTPKPLYIERADLAATGTPLASDAVLTYNQNHLVFEFALLTYIREADVRYRCQLVGLDSAPSDWSTDFKKEYTALPSGAYVFRVWGRDGAGNVTGPVDFPFSIKPAPWMTWWALVLYALVLSGLLWFASWLRLRTVEQRNRVLEARIAERTAELAKNVHQLEMSERAALDEKQKAIEANRAKTQFLANMSHELRTPLNAIIGFIQLMQKDRNRPPEDSENLAIIGRSSETLLALILDLLTVSRIETGRISRMENPFDVRLLLRGITEMFDLRAQETGVRFVCDIDDQLPQFVLGDEGRFRQVLVKLLGNAFKYTRRGSVTLSVRYDNERATVEVQDTGHGISQDEQESIFGAFVQGHRDDFYQEGAGIGLTISRSFVQLMGGELRLTSEPGAGSTFFFDIPLPEATMTTTGGEHRRVVALSPNQPVYRVLVVDDKWENRALLGKMLASVGIDVREASSGAEAIDTWERWRPHLIWMDRRMAGIDGIAATREIRAREGDDPACVIIAVTTSEYDVDRDALLAAGFNDSIAKPYRESEIFEKIKDHLGARFVYEDRTHLVGSRSADLTVDATQFEGLSADLLSQLRSALNQGDTGEAFALIDRIEPHDQRLAATLRTMLKGYRFDDIIEAIGES